jgi:hypothetical protein
MTIMENSVLKKIQQARKKIKEMNLEKQGYNAHSKYHYYLPEQVDKMVNDSSQELNLFNKYDLIRTELGLIARLTVIDLDNGNKEVFEAATEIPAITATNAAQQLGGAMTFSNRYLLMFTYDIVDNNLDFDAQKNQKQQQQPEKPWINPETKQWEEAIKYLKNGGKIIEIEKKYLISKKNKDILMQEAI